MKSGTFCYVQFGDCWEEATFHAWSTDGLDGEIWPIAIIERRSGDFFGVQLNRIRRFSHDEEQKGANP